MLRRVFCKLLLVAVVVFGLLALSGVLLAQGRSEIGLARAIEVQEAHTPSLMAIEGVEGTAIGLDDNGRLAVKIFTDGPGIAGIPKNLEGVPVKMVVTGKFNALKKPPWAGGPGGGDEEPTLSPTDRWPRPVPIGVSTGNEGECSAGTIGCRVTKGTQVFLLSNNHVLALENWAESNSLILQPGRYDADPLCALNPDDTIGTLSDFVEIDFDGGENTIDAAIALSSTDDLGNATPSDGYGTPNSSTIDASIGQQVQKYGRTTSLTKGIVSDVNFRGNIGYSSGTAYFVGQIVVYSPKRPFIKAGDSGSLLVTDPGKNPVGLIFAGSSSGKYAIANHIDEVLSAFGVDINSE